MRSQAAADVTIFGLQASSGPYALQKASKTRQPATHDVHVNLGPLTARAAFSHVPFWQSVAAMVGRIVQRRMPGNPAAAPTKAEYKEARAQLRVLGKVKFAAAWVQGRLP